MSKRVKGALTTPHIKSLLARIGSGVGGTKPELIQRLQSDLSIPKLRDGTRTSRVLSVDMGIRNMAFCVCDVSVAAPSKNFLEKPPVKLDILAWEPISVSDLAQHEEQASSSDPAALLSSQLSQQGKESFRPSILSRTAYLLLKHKLLPYAPQTILIEQQRYRTNASSAIQEWTYHVNMLEGMIWAILETLKQEQWADAASKESPTSLPLFPSVFPVSPARVAAFWMDNSELGRAIRDASLASRATRRSSAHSSSSGPADADEEKGAAIEADDETSAAAKKAGKKMSRSKVEKKDKIKLVEQWLLRNAERASSSSAASPSDRDVELSFGGREAGAMRDVFLSRLSKAAKRGGWGGTKKQAAAHTVDRSPLPDPKKLDDLADCLLQVAAWARWEGNRRAMLGLDERTLKEVAERCS
ncbi:DNA-binding SAP [Macrophomina phaseolina MS6]|uniref:DNA-binding SAP n=1 Tax=Macrophomina phaseolina (strain MS6) TaxID=1126212 RepID=K2SHE7_MACPH|nr:DNA-binding SAP [Macrophomina phaseolina MS6]